MVDHTSLIPKLSATEAPQVGLDLRAHRAQAGAGLARGDDVAQAERRRVEPASRARPARCAGNDSVP